MSDSSAELLIELSVDGGDANELDELTRQLRDQVTELNIHSVESVSARETPSGTKSVDPAVIGQMVVTLAPTIVPPLFELLKSWIERKPSTPVKIRVKVGKRTASIEYDPTKTTAKELNDLVKTLNRSLKK